MNYQLQSLFAFSFHRHLQSPFFFLNKNNINLSLPRQLSGRALKTIRKHSYTPLSSACM